MAKKTKKSRPKTYQAEKIIGNGSFGVVYKACYTQDGEHVAIKKVYQDKRYKNRELQILKILRHPFCIKMKHFFYTNGDAPDEVYLNVVMEHIPETLYKVMKNYMKQKQNVPDLYVKLYAYQLLRSIAYIHSMGICHRDIKPQNVLVDTDNHTIKLCDFGSAKQLIRGEPNISYICSRYYRAPELIFGNTEYDCSIDIWSVGCVIAELMLTMPIFPGESGVDQIVEIIKILGTPGRDEIKAMNPHYKEYRFPQISAIPWDKVFKPNTNPEAIRFVSRLLVYDPKERPHPLEALEDTYFDELRSQTTRMPTGASLPVSLFEFTQEENDYCAKIGKPEIIDALTPGWYKLDTEKMKAAKRAREEHSRDLENAKNPMLQMQQMQARGDKMKH